MQTIVELPEFLRKSEKLLKDSERQSIIGYLASHPESGALIQRSGGIRKLRWSAQGKGKGGGVRVVYYYHNGTMPIFLLTVFGKSEKANLAKGERNQLASLTALLLKNYGDPDE